MFRFLELQKVSFNQNNILEDYLWLFRIICFDIFEIKFMKILLKITFYILIFLTLFQTVVFLYESNRYYFIKYQPVYFGSFFILLSIYSMSPCRNYLITFMKNVNVWSIEHADPVVKRRIKREALCCHIFIVFNTAVAILSGILHALPLEADEEIFYTLATIKNFFPKWAHILCFFYRCAFILMALVMPASLYQVIYCTTYVRFQGYIILHRLQKVNKYTDNDTTELVDDEELQNKITKIFKFCVDQHSMLIRNGNQLLKKIKIYIFGYSVLGTILLISIITFIFSFQGSFEGRYARLITLIIAAGLLFVHVIICGQFTEEIGNDGYKILLLTSWYNFSRTNKGIYLLCIPHTLTGYKIKFSESISINYKLAASILKSVYSVLSVIGNFDNVMDKVYKN